MIADVNIFFLIAVMLYTATAAVTEIRCRRIPNYLTLSTALLGFIFHGLTPHGAGFLAALAGFIVGFGLLLLPWLFGDGGMSDIKLLAALGAWLGPYGMFVAFTGSVLLLVAVALLLLGCAATNQAAAVPASKHIRRLPQRQSYVVPYAVAVALSTWALLAWNLAQRVS